MSAPLPEPLRGVLERGRFLYLATPTPEGPHVSPVVFALWGGRLWVTTSRSSVKARRWKGGSRVGGVVMHGDLAVSFGGRVRTYDLLNPRSWAPSLRRSPTLTGAALKFTAKNAAFFAGYAVDARHVPLAWTPPGRVFASIELRDVALLDLAAGEALGAWTDLARWTPAPDGAHDEAWDAGMGLADAAVPSKGSFRAVTPSWRPLDDVPPEVGEAVSRGGRGVVALGAGSPRPIPVAWSDRDGAIVAAAPAASVAWSLGDGAPGPEVPATLVVDRASAWRARDMAGVLLRGTASLFRPAAVRSGSKSASLALLELEADPDRSVLIRLVPDRAVWWRGWAAGTVRPR